MSVMSRIGGSNNEEGIGGSTDNPPPVRLLIVDDSAVMRSLLERMLGAQTGIYVVRSLPTAGEAFDFLEHEPVDIVLLDHEMPEQKGLEALPRMIRAARGAHIVMLSSHCQRGSEIAVAALSLGASDAILKPTRANQVPAFTDMLMERFRELGAARNRSVRKGGHLARQVLPDGFRLACIGIGASTGGIHTLGTVLAELGRGKGGRLGVPILITQHLPEAFIPYYAQQVERMTDLPVSIAVPGLSIEPDHVYVAPGDASLSCRREGETVRVVLIDRRDPITRARPSVNEMFAGIADCYGEGGLGIVLTGMGRDGTAGANRIVEAGGAVIAQDEASSIVWGMPGSVTRAGLVCANLPPDKIADYVHRRIGRR